MSQGRIFEVPQRSIRNATNLKSIMSGCDRTIADVCFNLTQGAHSPNAAAIIRCAG